VKILLLVLAAFAVVFLYNYANRSRFEALDLRKEVRTNLIYLYAGIVDVRRIFNKYTPPVDTMDVLATLSDLEARYEGFNAVFYGETGALMGPSQLREMNEVLKGEQMAVNRVRRAVIQKMTDEQLSAEHLEDEANG
jgi:hypothetical protein